MLLNEKDINKEMVKMVMRGLMKAILQSI
ncbi:hypothetical protein CHLV4142_10330 [Campylobacter helveticus]|nr:hypothetical protein [Campylobacter helveticus]MCR2040536.1 hypothetical protein [Campylobacter helveticus]